MRPVDATDLVEMEKHLSIFAGSFSVDEASALIPGLQLEQVAEAIGLLLGRGSLTQQQHLSGPRYRLPEARRQAGQIALPAGEKDALLSHLVDHYLILARRSLDKAFGPERAVWIDRLEQEHDNLQPVFEWLVDRGEAGRGLKLAYLLQELWFEDCHTGEGRRWFAALLDLPSARVSTPERASCLDLAGAYALSQEDYVAARRLKQEGLEICRELGDRAGLGSALIHLGHVEFYAGEFPAAYELYREALQVFIELDDPLWIARATGNLSNAALELGDCIQADRLVKDSLQRYLDLGLEWELAVELGIAAGVAARLGRLERALVLAAASAAHRQRLGVSLPVAFRERFEQMIAPALQNLDEEQQNKLRDQGSQMTMKQAAEYALAAACGE